MSQETIPTGRDTKAPQADGVPSEKPAAAAPSEKVQLFEVAATWTGDAMGCGEIRVAGLSLGVPIGGSKELGGCGKGANPEELLLSAVGACFINTWAIFIQKLQLDYPDPALRVTGELAKDPAGGYRMTKATVFARVPAALLSSQREKVEKTLSLAEKYCITTKVAKAAMPLEVRIEEIG
jgi:organic hydroperoxide reductase OsmC/OhrA